MFINTAGGKFDLLVVLDKGQRITEVIRIQTLGVTKLSMPNLYGNLYLQFRAVITRMKQSQLRPLCHIRILQTKL